MAILKIFNGDICLEIAVSDLLKLFFSVISHRASKVTMGEHKFIYLLFYLLT